MVFRSALCSWMVATESSRSSEISSRQAATRFGGRRQGRDATGLGLLLEGAPGGGITASRVGRYAVVEGVVDAAVVLVGEAGGHPGQEAVG